MFFLDRHLQGAEEIQSIPQTRKIGCLQIYVHIHTSIVWFRVCVLLRRSISIPGLGMEWGEQPKEARAMLPESGPKCTIGGCWHESRRVQETNGKQKSKNFMSSDNHITSRLNKSLLQSLRLSFPFIPFCCSEPWLACFSAAWPGPMLLHGWPGLALPSPARTVATAATAISPCPGGVVLGPDPAPGTGVMGWHDATTNA